MLIISIFVLLNTYLKTHCNLKIKISTDNHGHNIPTIHTIIIIRFLNIVCEKVLLK